MLQPNVSSAVQLQQMATSPPKITIEHRCGSKQIQMTIDENTAGTLLKNLMADKLSLDASDSNIASVLTQEQMKGIQSLMDPNHQ
jgi:Holliday junction resolvasome RuvABC ATP-dependent DNA helicase subunit